MSLAYLNALDTLNETFYVLYSPAWFGRSYIPHHKDVTSSYEYKLVFKIFNAQIRSLIVVILSLIILSVAWLSIKLYVKYIEPRIKKKRN